MVRESFSDLLRRKVETRCGDFWALTDMGSFRCVGLTRQKEPDVALLPVGRHQTEDWPSMVIEVGVSEHLCTAMPIFGFRAAGAGCGSFY